MSKKTDLKTRLEQFWLLMTELAGGSWVSQYGNFGESPSVRWLQLLERDGVTADTLAAATRHIVDVRMKSAGGEYVPSYAVLAKLCQDVALGVHAFDVPAARAELLDGARNWLGYRWSSPIVYALAKAIGQARIRTSSQEDLDRRIVAELPDACRKVAAGQVAMPQLPEERPSAPEIRSDSATIKSKRDKLLDMLRDTQPELAVDEDSLPGINL